MLVPQLPLRVPNFIEDWLKGSFATVMIRSRLHLTNAHLIFNWREHDKTQYSYHAFIEHGDELILSLSPTQRFFRETHFGPAIVSVGKWDYAHQSRKSMRSLLVLGELVICSIGNQLRSYLLKTYFVLTEHRQTQANSDNYANL